MRTHQNEYILQENERILDGQGQKHRSQKSSCEEVKWVHNSPPRRLVNFQEQRVEAFLGFFETENVESAIDVRNEEHRDEDRQHEENVGQ